MVITFDNVSFKYIERKLLNNASFSITDTDKIGVVGVNGTGKSTLLKLIVGLEKPNSGSIIKSGGMVINYLPQDPVFPSDKSLLEIIMESSTKEHPVNDYEAKSILSKLKLNDYNQTATLMSGGERKRLALAKVLVTYCDMLILDEPTNHLDNDMIMWLEKYLIKWKKGLIMVTHDRYFLERVCQKMMEVDFGNVYIYQANYSKFLKLKEERINQENHQMQKLKSILKVETEWMNKSVEARRTKSKSRIERFEKLSAIEFNEKKTMEFSTKETRLGKKLIEIHNGSKAYNDKVLFTDFNFQLQRSDVIGIVGDNGAGKTTLFKIIMGKEKLDSGELILGETLKIGYFSQHLDEMNPDIRVIDYITKEQEQIETLDGVILAKDLLENFMFDSTLQYSKLKMLSGGEKRRLQLVKVLMTNPNLLILDEPTNDLDIYTLEILENFLDSFKGPVLIVSHDRYFLDKVCNKLFVFENSHINEYMLSFSEYLALDTPNQMVNKGTDTRVRKPKMSTKDKNELFDLENNIPLLEDEIAKMKEELSSLTCEYEKILKLTQDIHAKEKDLDNKMERYFELSELKESFEN